MPWTKFSAGSETALTKLIVENLKAVGDYHAPWWYHPMLAGCPVGKALGSFKSERQTLTDEEGGEVDVDWLPAIPFATGDAGPTDKANNVLKICLHFPGVGSDSGGVCSRNFALYMVSQGFVCAIINPRGRFTKLKTPRLWHGGHIKDAALVCEYIARSANQATHVLLVGYSGSTNIIQKYLLHAFADPVYASFNNNSTEISDKAPRFNLSELVSIVGGVALSPTYDYVTTRDAAEKTLVGLLLSVVLTSKYKAALKAHPHMHPLMDQTALVAALQCTYVSEWDKVAFPLLGFRSEEEQYEFYSSFENSKMRVPFLCIQPQDDILHANNFAKNCPLDKFLASPYMVYMNTSHGSHLAFVSDQVYGEAYTFPARLSTAFYDAITAQRFGGDDQAQPWVHFDATGKSTCCHIQTE